MTAIDWFIEGMLLGVGTGLLAARVIRQVARRLRRSRVIQSSKHSNTAPTTKNIAELVWQTRRAHTYTCKGCSRSVNGLDYCLPRDWRAGLICVDEDLGFTQIEYACSPACVKKVAKEAST